MKAKLTKPPMGWNSWDCYGASVTEEEVRRNAEYMAKNLKEFGWEYVVVDIQWFEPNAKSADYIKNAPLIMDEYSRLMPAVNRFPSAEGGKGFKPLADYVHSLGLKFGIHILRGIPKQAVRQNTKILGTTHTAAEIADFGSVCDWNGDMCGVVFAPVPRDYEVKMNKKERRAALKSALTSKVQDNKLVVVDSLALAEVKTKEMQKVLTNLKAEKALVITADNDQNVILSARNIADVETATPATINTYDVMKHNTVVVTKDAVASIEEVYA